MRRINKKRNPSVPSSPQIFDQDSGQINGKAEGHNPWVRKGCRKQMTKKLDICTFNIRSMAKDEKLLELQEELDRIRWDVLGLCEVRRKGEELIQLPTDHMLYYKGEDDHNIGGVGFLINKRMKNNILEYKAISSRVAYVIIRLTSSQNMKAIQIYAPTTDHDDDEIELFYEEITLALGQTPCKYNIVMGDFNAKLGKKTAREEDKIGNFGLGDRNNRGHILISFMEQQNMFAMNTFFYKNPCRKWTWMAPNRSTKNEIDYILSPHKTIFKDVSVLNSFSTGSDHRLVRASIQINIKWERAKKITKPIPKINREDLRENTHIYNQHIKTKLEEHGNLLQMNLNELNDAITSSITEASLTTAKQKNSKMRRISEDTRKLFEKRRKLIHQGQRGTAEFSTLNKQIRKQIGNEQKKKTEEKIIEFIEKNKSMKCLQRQGGKKQIIKIKDSEGTETHNRNEITETIELFYKNLYKSQKDPPNEVCELLKKTIINVNSEEIPDITEEEIKSALSHTKNNKAAGKDGIIAEMLKEGGEDLLNAMKILFNKCLQECNIPTEWNDAQTVLLFKKGDKASLENYRPITLLSQMYKLLTKIITNRLTNKLEYYQPKEQAGFRRGFSTCDHLLTLRTLIEKSTEYNLPLYLIFIDYEKAFDTIERWTIESGLQNSRVDSRYTQLIRNIYKYATTSVQTSGSTNPIPIKRGVRQGDTLSPKLFITALEEIFKTLNWENNGLNINGERLNNLRYADDIVLISETFDEIAEMFNELRIASEQVGLKINFGKTKIMSNLEDNRQLSVENNNIEKVEEYVYLGQIMKMGKENQTAEVQRRVRLGWAAFSKSKHIITNQNIPLNLRSQVFNQCIIPVLSYGAQTWTMTKANMDKLTKVERAMERKILNITLKDRKRNEWIRQKTKVIDIAQHAANLKWRFAGHTMRQPDNRWNKIMQDWRPWLGKRNRGRPQLRWADDIKRAVGFTWRQMATNRETWQHMREAFVQRWTNTG